MNHQDMVENDAPPWPEGPLRRRHVLVSAYACEPDKGSEPGVGLQVLKGWLRLGATVSLITRRNNVAALLTEFRPEIETGQLHIIDFDLGPAARSFKCLPGGVQLYYAIWQIALSRHICAMAGSVDVAHHATFAVDWLPAAVVRLAQEGIPTIWGPVGGSTACPSALRTELSWRERIFEITRDVTGSLGRKLFGYPAARSVSLTIAQNDDVMARFTNYARHLLKEPNVFIARGSDFDRRDVDPHAIVGVGRLLGWKGWAIAIRALTLMPQEFHLTIFGEGPSRPRLERLIRKHSISDRVYLAGWCSRDEVIRAVSTAHCLVHPSFHDSAAGAIGEALIAGCPTVVIGAGGSRTIVDEAGGIVVNPDDPEIAQTLALAMESPAPPRHADRWSSERIPGLLLDWYHTAVGMEDCHGVGMEDCHGDNKH